MRALRQRLDGIEPEERQPTAARSYLRGLPFLSGSGGFIVWPARFRDEVGCAREARVIGWLKANTSVRCPDCKAVNTYRAEEFGLALAEAKKGGLDPWRDMLRIGN
jgi:hypothetical protein